MASLQSEHFTRDHHQQLHSCSRAHRLLHLWHMERIAAAQLKASSLTNGSSITSIGSASASPSTSDGGSRLGGDNNITATGVPTPVQLSFTGTVLASPADIPARTSVLLLRFSGHPAAIYRQLASSHFMRTISCHSWHSMLT